VPLTAVQETLLEDAEARVSITKHVNSFDLAGHVAVVTGGNGGIGLGIARALTDAGAAVAIWARDRDKTQAAVAELTASGASAIGVECDVSDETSVADALRETLKALGRVDSCFANAGIGGTPSKFTDMSLQDWRAVTAVNLDGTFLTFRECARHMIAREGGGSLVATSSLTAIEAAPRNEHYAASKAGVIALVRSLAVEFARYGVRANALMPGWIETDITRPLLGSDVASTHILPRVPARRWGQPADLGAAAVYLASDASSYHTGDVLVIDGGYRLF
jgi:NAD(P)-dependent dehydrogenase (short-subunit alcohol dehydrogenase family)